MNADDARRTVYDRWFKNSKGELALTDTPNAPIITFVIAAVIAFLPIPISKYAASAVAYGALFTWAWLEVFQGVNYFRRTLGALVGMILVSVTAIFCYSDAQR